MKMLRNASTLGAFSISAITLVGGCGTEEVVAPSAPFETLMVGRVTDSTAETVVALAINGNALTIYSCGGKDTVADNTHWWNGTIASDSFRAEADGWTVEGTREGTSAKGTIHTDDGHVLEWAALSTPVSEVGGLYVDGNAGCRTGVVVLPAATAGEEPWVQGSACDDSGIRAQVTPVHPSELSVRGFDVLVATTSRQIAVQRIPF